MNYNLIDTSSFHNEFKTREYVTYNIEIKSECSIQTSKTCLINRRLVIVY